MSKIKTGFKLHFLKSLKGQSAKKKIIIRMVDENYAGFKAENFACRILSKVLFCCSVFPDFVRNTEYLWHLLLSQ